MTRPKVDLLMWSISQCVGEGGRGGRGDRGEGTLAGKRRGERETITVINYKQEKKRPLLITCLSANRIFYEVSVTKTHGPSAERHHFLV